nr:predicted GPI-anchored protein 58 [Aegilops tauschii subsp. strangulata]
MKVVHEASQVAFNAGAALQTNVQIGSGLAPWPSPGAASPAPALVLAPRPLSLDGTPRLADCDRARMPPRRRPTLGFILGPPHAAAVVVLPTGRLRARCHAPPAPLPPHTPACAPPPSSPAALLSRAKRRYRPRPLHGAAPAAAPATAALCASSRRAHGPLAHPAPASPSPPSSRPPPPPPGRVGPRPSRPDLPPLHCLPCCCRYPCAAPAVASPTPAPPVPLLTLAAMPAAASGARRQRSAMPARLLHGSGAREPLRP